jgi:His-Xaa-Ser system radical SAM maturase HxsB
VAKFKQELAYQDKSSHKYSLLPFNFCSTAPDQYRLVSISGESAEVDSAALDALVNKDLPYLSSLYVNLRSKGFIFDAYTKFNVDLAALKLRTKMAHVFNLTSLHIFVLSLRCEHSCPYCQVSRKNLDANRMFDMSSSVASKGLDVVFASPSKSIKIEFQGGEPLLNFPLLKQIVLEAEKLAETGRKKLEFVIATNLAVIDSEMLDFCRIHGISISTSLDGPEELHNSNRPRPGQDSYARTIRGIELARDYLGHDRVSALMTTSPASLLRFRAIIDEYIRLGFGGLFLRPLSPYGFAIKTKWAQKYSIDEWLDAYRDGLDYIMEINRSGLRFVEFYTALIAQRILKPHFTGYVDLQHPTGSGLSALVYNYDGRVYSSDEGRMLAEMGDDSFCIGHLDQHSYSDLMTSTALTEQVGQSFGPTASRCDECAYLPYCGSDPTFHYATQNDYMGNKVYSAFCDRQMGVIEHVFNLLGDDKNRYILESWIS